MRESDVRAALLERLTAKSPADEHTRYVHELDLCQAEARIDLAAVNGRLTGWEIKTAADTLARLPQQEAVYSRVFDRVWLVADTRHIDAALGVVPGWWGVVRVSERSGVRLAQVRPSRLNPAVDLSSLVRLLWRSEALAELERLDLAAGLGRAPRRELWQRLAEAVPSHLTRPQLQTRVRDAIRSRTGWRVQ